jgi:cysteine-rich repeat protein
LCLDDSATAGAGGAIHKKLALATLLLLAIVLPLDAGAQDKCGAAKLKAAGKKAYGKAACYAKARAKGIDVDPTCLQKVEIKFSAIFQKYDPSGNCLTTGDAGAIEAKVDAWAQDVFDELRANCGDGVVQAPEACDDGNTLSGDGCSNVCHVEPGWDCTGEPSTCVTTCGDGVRAGTETCDDGNTASGDGCASDCTVEPGYECSGVPSVCVVVVCGDGLVTGSETCDDGNTGDGDGCSAACQVESGWACAGQPSVCGTICGDGIVAGPEECDDGNTADGDGCSSTCGVESGFTCTGQPSVCTPL